MTRRNTETNVYLTYDSSFTHNNAVSSYPLVQWEKLLCFVQFNDGKREWETENGNGKQKTGREMGKEGGNGKTERKQDRKGYWKQETGNRKGD